MKYRTIPIGGHTVKNNQDKIFCYTLLDHGLKLSNSCFTIDSYSNKTKFKYSSVNFSYEQS